MDIANMAPAAGAAQCAALERTERRCWSEADWLAAVEECRACCGRRQHFKCLGKVLSYWKVTPCMMLRSFVMSICAAAATATPMPPYQRKGIFIWQIC
jgi:hypothetical protein